VSRRLAATLVAAAGVALVLPLEAAAARTAVGKRVDRGISHAARIGWIKAPDASRYRTSVYLSERGARFLYPGRARVLESQLRQVSTLWDSYISPRALALFSQLRVNADYLASHAIPADGTDVTGPDGVVYRWFAGKGFEFHPLANFSQLDNLASAKNVAGTRQLADALVARGIPRPGGRLYWEYAFPYGIGRPPWASGLAQAVAAQALGRASVLLGDPSLLAAARKAYATIPAGLVQTVAGQPWIRLYGFNREVVLNAQLQTIVSLREYATTAGDAGAQALADRLLAAAKTLFPRFDTGDWSLYELGGGYANRGYQEFVTDLLRKLAKQTQDPFWADAAARFVNYTYQPPVVTQPQPTPLAVPQPADGYLDTVQIPISLSKRASLTVSVGGTILTYRRVPPGAQVLTWKGGAALAPGTYPVTVRAVDFGGNHASYALAPLTVMWDTSPPQVTPSVDATTNVLAWQGNDPGTPWLALRLELSDPSGAQPPQTLDLGQQPVSGSLQLALPPGTWNAVLDATNSAGLTTQVPLGTLTGAMAQP
jgi:hypothetical protein